MFPTRASWFSFSFHLLVSRVLVIFVHERVLGWKQLQVNDVTRMFFEGK